jgi:hypothetical protein
MKRTILLMVVFLLACGFDNNQAPKAGEYISLTGKDYKADTVVPATVIPPDRPMAVFYSKITCDISIAVYEIAGAIMWKTKLRDVSGLGGTYIDTSRFKEGLYFCSIKYSRNGKTFKQVISKFVYAKKRKTN